METLNQIGLKFDTDKASRIHGYLNKYEKYLPFTRGADINLLEIGVYNGASLKMWREYFIHAQIIGIDIDARCREYETEDISIVIGSQNDRQFLFDVNEKYGPFDLIIDDGSHINSDQIFSFKVLFPMLAPGGVYIIEDTCTSYWKKFGGGLYCPGSCIEYFKGLIDQVNFYGEYIKNPPDGIPRRARRDDLHIKQNSEAGIPDLSIESINFINSIIMVTKRS